MNEDAFKTKKEVDFCAQEKLAVDVNAAGR